MSEELDSAKQAKYMTIVAKVCSADWERDSANDDWERCVEQEKRKRKRIENGHNITDLVDN